MNGGRVILKVDLLSLCQHCAKYPGYKTTATSAAIGPQNTILRTKSLFPSV